MESADFTDELEQSLRHVGRLRRSAEMLLRDLEDVEEDLRRLAIKVAGADSVSAPVVASADSAQAAWISLMGRRARMGMREFYASRTELIHTAAALPETERAKLRGDLSREVLKFIEDLRDASQRV